MLEHNRVLFVAWQDPSSRRFYPVARLSWLGDNEADALYEFAYIQGAWEARSIGFQPFLSFPNFDQLYLGRQLFPLFANRLMSPKRADYPQYVRRLGLDLASSTGFEVLGRSGGRRTTDAIEVFSLPTLDPESGTYRTYFFAHSLRYLAPASQEKIEKLALGDQLLLMHDMQNPVDPSAVALRTDDYLLAGFIPAYLTELAHHFLRDCGVVTVSVERLNVHPAPIQQRLLCRWESLCPPRFALSSIRRYLPIPKDATVGPFVETGRELPTHEEVAG